MSVRSGQSVSTLLLFSLLTTLSLVSTQIPVPSAQCPSKTPFGLIDLKELTGQWYEIEASPNFLEFPFKCVSMQVTPFFERKSDISLRAVNRISEETIIYNVTGTIPETSNEKDGILSVTITLPDTDPNGEIIHGRQLRERYQQMHIQILATDYSNWSIVWMCNKNENKKTHTELLWVLSREQSLTSDQYKAVQEAKQAHHVEWIKTQDSVQCFSSGTQIGETDNDQDYDPDTTEE